MSSRTPIQVIVSFSALQPLIYFFPGIAREFARIGKRRIQGTDSQLCAVRMIRRERFKAGNDMFGCYAPGVFEGYSFHQMGDGAAAGRRIDTAIGLKIDFSAHSLRSIKAQRTQRDFFLFRFAESR